MSRGESERRQPDPSPSPEPAETRTKPPASAAEPPGALRRIGHSLRVGWRRVGGLPGLLATVTDGARWLYRNRRRIGAGIRRAGEILVAILKTAARVGAVLVRMGEALARLEEQRTAKPVGAGRRRAARAGAGLSRFGRRLDHYGRGLLPVADGIEDIGEHLETAAPGDSEPLPPALPDPAPSPAPDAAPPEASPAPARRAPSAPPAEREAISPTVSESREPAAPRPPADERPPPVPTRASAAKKKKKKKKKTTTTTTTTEPVSPTLPEPPADGPTAALPDELRGRIQGLPRRPKRAEMETLIEDLCRAHGWSSSAELAAILGRDPRSLNRQYLKPMAAAGRLIRRHPDRLRHPNQAFTVPK